ncbi:hypothetical protein KR50_35170 [Jeotgalibacillus campisalis]|uniref:Uncharacterized protein n=1 Tax=Jeotgalibacillus campisalis TaxID=220754 RepID=A0A0C2RMX1_9BACL|nr:hypothetical protein KR50_35170 [Jeotgalibacillus campisalis]
MHNRSFEGFNEEKRGSHLKCSEAVKDPETSLSQDLFCVSGIPN